VQTHPAQAPSTSPAPEPLNLVLTMIPGPGDRLMLALVERVTGQHISAIQISAHHDADDVAPGKALVTVTVLADLVPPASNRTEAKS
jgi:hypothetical protein